MNSYDISAKAMIPGAITRIVWRPSLLTTRMRNSVIAQLRDDECHLAFSYSSVAAKLMEHVCGAFYMPFARQSHGGCHVHFYIQRGDVEAFDLLRRHAVAQDVSARMEDDMGSTGGYRFSFENEVLRNREKILEGIRRWAFLHSGAQATAHAINQHYANTRTQKREQIIEFLHSNGEIELVEHVKERARKPRAKKAKQ